MRTPDHNGTNRESSNSEEVSGADPDSEIDPLVLSLPVRYVLEERSARPTEAVSEIDHFVQEERTPTSAASSEAVVLLPPYRRSLFHICSLILHPNRLLSCCLLVLSILCSYQEWKNRPNPTHPLTHLGTRGWPVPDDRSGPTQSIVQEQVVQTPAGCGSTSSILLCLII